MLFDLVFDIIGEITEEVDACKAFKFADGLRERLERFAPRRILFMIRPEADGFVVISFFAKDGHIHELGD